jgi:hypothetical protein
MNMNFYYRGIRHFLFTLGCVLLFLSAAAQDTLLPPPVLDTIAPTPASGTVRPTAVDSAVVDLSKVKFSDDGLTEEISYGAKDSMWFDVVNKQVHLYGEATVKYTTLNITAGYILLDYAKNEITAIEFPDSTGRMSGAPEFKDKDQAFEANKLRYNFKTKKGIIYEARTKQEDLYVLGQKAKFVGGPEGDTSARNTIYNYDAIITTCNADHPHFGVRTKKLKVIQDKLVVTGLSNVEIAGIPTPLVLPFGFYPITKTRKAGLILPQDFNFAEREGLGLQDFGWYQPINEHMDAKLLLSAFVNGSFGVTGTTNYNYKYKHSGSFLLRYNRRVSENDKAEKIYFPSFSLQIRHQQDAAAHPTRKIGGSVNIETNRDQNRNQNDFASVYRNQLNSNFTLNKIYPGRPYQFNLGFTHNQNTQTRKMNITLPEATFTLQRIYPFKRKNGIGKEKWYEKMSLTYNSQLRNSLNDVTDTTLFTRSTLRNIKSGVQHKASTDFNFKVAKFINITPNANYDESWYPYITTREFDPTPQFKFDSIFQNITPSERRFVGLELDSNGTKWGRDTLIRKYGFYQYRNFNAGISASTSIFGTVQFKKGWLKGIRHKISPSASIGFGPDYSKNTNFFREVETSSRPGRSNKRQYSIFDEGIYGRPSASARSMVLNYSLLNVLEIKHFSKRDTTGWGKKTKIFDNLNFSGNYNFSADSLRWSTVGTNGVFRFFKGLTTLNWRLSFDPYILNENGRRVNRYTVKNGGKLARLDQFGININTGFTVSQIRDMIENRGEKDGATKKNAAQANANKAPDDLIGWLDRFNFSHYVTYERQFVPQTNRDTFLIGQHNISVRGDIPISAKWSVNISNISYDIKEKQFVYPDLGITRDLHCWQMSLSWQPTRGTYFFTINAKPGTFQFLKAPYRQNNFDARGGF